MWNGNAIADSGGAHGLASLENCQQMIAIDLGGQLQPSDDDGERCALVGSFKVAVNTARA
jgi:hypothetical protein